MSSTILVVDDSLTVRMDLVAALDAAGLRAVPCGSLKEAREALAREQFALVILDVSLPDGDGIDFLGELRALPAGAQTFVMLLSTEAEVGARVRGLAHGADDYVGKPYDTSYVIARARQLIRRGKASGGSLPSLILVIDDSVTFREELRRALVEAGHEVAVAGSGEEGLRLAADLRPTAIVVDGVLPGIAGAAVVRRLRLDAALRRTPCLLLTASEDEGDELRALDAGADAFVRKGEDIPVILARLSAVLRSAVGGSDGEDTVSLLGPKKILAVDDSLTYLHALAEQLRSEGYDVVLAHSGEEALELLAVQPVDCILLDLLMPGLGGHETCRRIKLAPAIRDTPLIMLTALEDRDALLRGLGAGADDFIAKSSDIEVLKARVLAQIRRKQFEDENRRFRDQLQRKVREAGEASAARDLAEMRALLVNDLERKNRELEAFSYSVSHDLRAPLRSIDGFSQALLEDCHDQLDEQGRDHLRRVRAGVQHMGKLIDAMLSLSRVARAELRRDRVDLSRLASAVAADLRATDRSRDVDFVIAGGIEVLGDPDLLHALLENLFGNAWKFTSRRAHSRLELGIVDKDARPTVYFVRDNGAGFDMAHAYKLFTPFQRLHAADEFAGTGIGLATVQRIVDRHGGRIWAEGAVDVGATVHFTLTSPPEREGT
ncbi:MAG: arcB [Myxococcaceae bacterium]|nr:arcB [Myxococcaceae bacterium]